MPIVFARSSNSLCDQFIAILSVILLKFKYSYRVCGSIFLFSWSIYSLYVSFFTQYSFLSNIFPMSSFVKQLNDSNYCYQNLRIGLLFSFISSSFSEFCSNMFSFSSLLCASIIHYFSWRASLSHHHLHHTNSLNHMHTLNKCSPEMCCRYFVDTKKKGEKDTLKNISLYSLIIYVEKREKKKNRNLSLSFCVSVSSCVFQISCVSLSRSQTNLDSSILAFFISLVFFPHS